MHNGYASSISHRDKCTRLIPHGTRSVSMTPQIAKLYGALFCFKPFFLSINSISLESKFFSSFCEISPFKSRHTLRIFLNPFFWFSLLHTQCSIKWRRLIWKVAQIKSSKRRIQRKCNQYHSELSSRAKSSSQNTPIAVRWNVLVGITQCILRLDSINLWIWSDCTLCLQFNQAHCQKIHTRTHSHAPNERCMGFLLPILL